MTTRKASAPLDARKAEPQDARAGSAPPAGAWPPWMKWVASALIAFHVAAVFWGPLAFASRGSPLTGSVAGVLRPYMDALYLNRGYSFFAPDVGPSRLVRYKIEFAGGREPVVGVFPNLATEWPRLLYHRHFMLSEELSNRFVPPEPPREPMPPPEPTPPPLTATEAERARYNMQKQDYAAQRASYITQKREYPQALANWQHARRQYEAMWKSFEEHLLAAHGGSKVTLTRVEHRLALPDEVEFEGRRLNAPDSYLDLPEAVPPEPVRPEPRP